MEISFENILVLLFILFPLIQRLFGKKPKAAEPLEKDPFERSAEPAKTGAEEDWQKELERLFGVPQEGEGTSKKDEEIEWDEPVAETQAPPQPPVQRRTAPIPVDIREEVVEKVRVETARDEFKVFTPQGPLREPAFEERTAAFSYHAPKAMDVLQTSHETSQDSSRARGIADALKDRKELQKAFILGEILQKRGGMGANRR
jgi:hypothetical protein